MPILSGTRFVVLPFPNVPKVRELPWKEVEGHPWNAGLILTLTIVTLSSSKPRFLDS